MTPHILIVEDEPAIALGLKNDLALEGYEVEVATDGQAGLERAREGRPDLILLDIRLPKKDGFAVCRELRRTGVRTPIIMLTARAEDTDKVLGLELGADDYVTKPFSPMELCARVKAVLRRTTGERASRYRFGDVEIDFERCQVRRAQTTVELTPLEFKVLAALIQAEGRLLTRDQLIEGVWGIGVSITDRVVDNHMLNLRRKIEREPSAPRYLMSVRGLGYRFEPPPESETEP
jgi:two-component system alkaline phosphatase synthesis response regulator PhoP